mmetsp:Transcript_5609/g.9681  ORF Transcript_5609/g.9681 Transcript_5609/m.9681 type:complete len:234 (-) Transcript_5609:395-1096(-)
MTVSVKVRVYSLSTARNSSAFPPSSMLLQMFSLVSTRAVRKSLNSPDTSCCRFRNKPWSTKGPTCVGCTGSKMHLSAIQLVAKPTMPPPTVSVHGLSQNIHSTIWITPRRPPNHSPELVRNFSSSRPHISNRSESVFLPCTPSASALTTSSLRSMTRSVCFCSSTVKPARNSVCRVSTSPSSDPSMVGTSPSTCPTTCDAKPARLCGRPLDNTCCPISLAIWGTSGFSKLAII